MAASVCSLGRAVQLVAFAVRVVLRLLTWHTQGSYQIDGCGGASGSAALNRQPMSAIRLGSRSGSDRSDESREQVARNVTAMTWRVTSIELPARNGHDRGGAREREVGDARGIAAARKVQRLHARQRRGARA